MKLSMSSAEVLNVYNSKFCLSFSYLKFIFDLKLTTWSNSFYLYMHRYIL